MVITSSQQNQSKHHKCICLHSIQHFLKIRDIKVNEQPLKKYPDKMHLWMDTHSKTNINLQSLFVQHIKITTYRLRFTVVYNLSIDKPRPVKFFLIAHTALYIFPSNSYTWKYWNWDSSLFCQISKFVFLHLSLQWCLLKTMLQGQYESDG